MGMMSRFTTIVKAKASKLLDRAEDPRETLDYSYEKQLEMLQKVRRGVADVATAKKRLELQAAKLEQSVTKLDSQARQAISVGKEDLARVALERKKGVQLQLQDLDAQRVQLQGEQDKLVVAEQRLTSKVEAFRTKKETIKAQYTAAEAQVKIGEAVSGVGEDMADVGMAIDRAEQKTETMRARAGAIDELIESGTLTDLTSSSDSIDRELELVGLQSGVDAELEAMKKELGGGAAPSPEIESGEAKP
jgi:phage shock protein A